jgi:drug/metabolite transporter (DMT)-like permease
MAAALLALTAAFSWGTSDFLGGRVSRKVPSMLAVWAGGLVTTLLTGGVGLVMGLPDALAGALVFGGAGGITVALGAIALYQGLARGRSAVVAPTAGVIGAVIPVVVDLVRGVTLGPSAILGMLVGFGAIWLLAGGESFSSGGSGLWYGVAAGCGFGLMFVLLGLAPDGTGVWPVFASKLTSVALTTGMLGSRRLSPAVLGPFLPVVIGIGLADSLATTSYLFATRLGEVSIAAVIASFYPAPTVALSAVFHHEALRPKHWIGGVLAIAAIALVSL